MAPLWSEEFYASDLYFTGCLMFGMKHKIPEIPVTPLQDCLQPYCIDQAGDGSVLEPEVALFWIPVLSWVLGLGMDNSRSQFGTWNCPQPILRIRLVVVWGPVLVWGRCQQSVVQFKTWGYPGPMPMISWLSAPAQTGLGLIGNPVWDPGPGGNLVWNPGLSKASTDNQLIISSGSRQPQVQLEIQDCLGPVLTSNWLLAWVEAASVWSIIVATCSI